MKRLTLYHNPRCSKSRQALALIEERGLDVQIVEYLRAPPTRDELRALLRKLGMRPEQLVRKGEEACRKYRERAMSDEDWLDALAQDPILIERPILVAGSRATVGRPPEKILELV